MRPDSGPTVRGAVSCGLHLRMVPATIYDCNVEVLDWAVVGVAMLGMQVPY